MKQQRGVILITLKLELKGGREMTENKKNPQDVQGQGELTDKAIKFISTYSISKELNISTHELNHMLCQMNVQLKNKYGYFVKSNHEFIHGVTKIHYLRLPNGKSKVVSTVKWTPLGKRFILSKLFKSSS